MISVRSDVKKALVGNPELVTLLGGERVYNIRAPASSEWPRLTFFEVYNQPSDFADDKEVASLIQIQVDIWLKYDQLGSLTKIMTEIEQAMVGAGFVRTVTSPDLPEDECFHKAMRFNIKKDSGK